MTWLKAQSAERIDRRQLVAAGSVDRLRLILCPLVLPQTGAERAFLGYPDLQFEFLGTRVIDGRVLVLDYRPNGPALVT